LPIPLERTRRDLLHSSESNSREKRGLVAYIADLEADISLHIHAVADAHAALMEANRQLRTINGELEEWKEELETCILCRQPFDGDVRSRTCLLPCGHAVVCAECVSKMEIHRQQERAEAVFTCYMCRQQVDDIAMTVHLR
jgi:hypothetical protein